MNSWITFLRDLNVLPAVLDSAGNMAGRRRRALRRG
jgi:hypothetical protein